MARIVCQVLHRGDRVTFLWSEGAASFEPYHLEGAERANLLDLAGQIHAKLADGDGAALAQLGHRLYRAVFRLDAGAPGSAALVHPWLTDLAQGGNINVLEFLSDMPGLIPWNLLLDRIPGAGDAWPHFFGARFNLGAGRRVNILRQNPVQVKPIQRMAADLDLVDQLVEIQKPFVTDLREGGELVHTCSSLADEFKKQVPDVILLLVRFEQGRLWLGADSFGLAELQSWMAEPREGNPDPIVILMGCGARAEQSAWQALLCAASATISGLVANATLLPAAQAFAVGHALAQRFLEGPKSLGENLQTLRQEQGAAGLAFSAFCPPEMRVAAEPVSPPAEDTPLPRLPYHPFAPYDVSDRALFFGREEDTLRGAQLADQAETCGILLHGAPAVGKTSYLQAGLLPFLETESVGYRVLRDRSPLDTPVAEGDYPLLILRATGDLAGQFADALTVFCAQPYTYTTPKGTQVTVDLPTLLQQATTGSASAPSTAIQASDGASAITADAESAEENEGASAHELWIALRDNKGLLARILDAITSALPFELVIAVDQGEELISLVRTSQQQVRRAKALAMLMDLAGASARCKIVFTIRSQALGQFVSLLPGGQASKEWRSFYLAPLTEIDMIYALQLPTSRDEVPYSAEVPFEKYGFAFEDGAVQQIVGEAAAAAAADQQSPLPILQAVGALLYDKQVLGKKQNTVGLSDVKLLGGVKEALSKCLDRSIERLNLTRVSQRALRNLIGKLYVSHTDGTLSRDVVPATDLKSRWIGSPDPVEAVVNQAADDEGLFEIQQLMIAGQTDVYVSLPQDSLAQLGRKIVTERELQAHGRTKIIDTLWIMIPLAFLCAAIAFFVTRNFLGRASDGDPSKAEEKLMEKAREFADAQIKSAYADKTRRPIYYGQIARADQALRADNALRARQILLEAPASRNFYEDTEKIKLADLRGFEWKYLWKHLHSERFLLAGHRGTVTSVAVSADGKRAASAGQRTDQNDDATIRIWNLETGELLARIIGPKFIVNAVAFSPDGKTLASAGADKSVRLWDIGGLKDDLAEPAVITKEAKTLAGHQDAVHALAYGKDDKTLASAGADKAVILWDVAGGKEKYTLKEHAAAVHALAFSSDGKTLASAGAEAQVILWDAEAGKKREAVKTPFQAIAALALSPDGKTLAAGGVDAKLDAEVGVIRFWNVADAKETRAPIHHSSGVLALAFRSDGEAIASGGKDFLVRLWSIKTGKEQHRWVGHYGAITSLAFAKDALVSGSADRDVKVWNPEQSSGPDVIGAHADWVQSLALNTNNTFLASGARDGSVKLWNAADGRPLLSLPSLNGAVTALAFSSHKDKSFLAASTRNDKSEGAIQIWQIEGDLKKGFKAVDKHTFKGHDKGVTCLAFHPTADKADLLISGSADHTVKVWNLATGKEKETYKGHKDEVRSLAFTDEGRSFASGGKDGIVCLYDLDRKDIGKLTDMHAGSIEALAHVPLPMFRGVDQHEMLEGLLTGGADHAVRLWAYRKTEPGKAIREEMAAFRPHGQAISGLVYSAKNNGLIVTSSWDKTIKLTDMFNENFKLSGNERFTFQGHTDAVRALAFASDQSFLVSGGNDGTIRIWRAAADRVAVKVEGK